MKDKLIVFKIKNNYKNDPVDRLRGHDVIKALKIKGWNIELFNEQRGIDILVSLDSDYKAFCTLSSFQSKKLVIDIQDDHINFNKKSLNQISLHNQGRKKRIIKLVKNNDLMALLYLYIYRKLSKLSHIKLLRKADYVITSSKSLELSHSRFNDNIECIPDSVNFKSYKKDLSINKNIINQKDKKIVWIGTASNIKYLLLVNELLSKLQENFNVKIVIITSKEIFKEESFKMITENFNFNFDFVEWNKETYVENILKCDIGIAPLPKGISKSTNKILSYMACGLPVLCSGSFDYHDLYIKNDNAFLYSDNYEQWYEYIENLISSNDKYNEIAINAYKLSKQHDINNLVAKYEDVFYKVFRT